MEIKIHKDEAQKIAGYLLDYSPREDERALYESYVRMKSIMLSGKETPLWSLMLGNKFLFYFCDCGLGFFYPQSPIRQRILCMLGVLETRVHLADRFLIAKTSAFLLFLHAAKAAITLPLILLSGLFLKIYLR